MHILSVNRLCINNTPYVNIYMYALLHDLLVPGVNFKGEKCWKISLTEIELILSKNDQCNKLVWDMLNKLGIKWTEHKPKTETETPAG